MFATHSPQQGASTLNKTASPSVEPSKVSAPTTFSRSTVDVDAVRSRNLPTSKTSTGSSLPSSPSITQVGDLHGLVGSGRLEVEVLPRTLASITLSNGRDLAHSVETNALKPGSYVDKVRLNWSDGSSTKFSTFKIAVSN